MGVDSLYNGGNAPAVIDRLILVDPRHIKLVGAYITIGGSLVGNWETFPPPARALYRAEPGVHWAGRHKPAGTIVPPHQWALVALGLEPTAAAGRIASIDLYYHVSTAHYEWQGHVAIGLTVEPRPTASPAMPKNPLIISRSTSGLAVSSVSSNRAPRTGTMSPAATSFSFVSS
ncbi:MAG: hypothetical protein ACLP7J_19045 [Streptosporangiaceae bacterium]